MSVSPERFAQGLTYDVFKSGMTKNQDRFAANEEHLNLEPADIVAFEHIPQPLHVLVLAEDWCGDVIDNLPILGRVAAVTDKLDVRVFARDKNLDLMDQYLNEGKFRSIPVFVFLDSQFQEIGRFIERPASVTTRRAAIRRDIFARHPEFGSPETPVDQLSEDARVQLQQETAQRRADSKQLDERDVIQALRDIVERTA
jgi:hypothetical protein